MSESKQIPVRRTAMIVLAGTLLAAAIMTAQTPTGPRHFTAVTDNISGAKEPVKIDLVRWSSDAERDQLLAAWNLTPAPGRGGRGAGGGRGRGPADPAPDPAAVQDPFGSFGGAAAAAGRGGGRGGAAVEAPKLTPEASLKVALDKVPTVGYLWSSEVAGYALHYAVRLAEQDGGERILLITDRRLGATNDLWKPAGNAAATDYPFSVIELHMNAKGEGEGKSSLTGKVTFDAPAKTIALENYSALPVVLRNVKSAAK